MAKWVKKLSFLFEILQHCCIKLRIFAQTNKFMPTYTTEQYQALSAAIALGAVKVKYADKEVTYRSLQEMQALQYAMAQDLGLFNKGNGGKTYPAYNSGL